MSEPKTPAWKIRENRLRLVAARRGYTLFKSPRRDSRALDYGCYRLERLGTVGPSDEFPLKDLDAVERALDEGVVR